MQISVHSKPNSFVGLLGVDQSVLLLKKGNDIEKSTVFDELAKYNEVNKYNFEWSNYYEYSSFSDFKASEAVIITNAKKEYEREYIPMYYPESYGMRGFGGLAGPPGAPYPQSSFSGLSLNRQPPPLPPAMYDRDRVGSVSMESMPAPPKVIEIRKEFPETWLFDSFDFNSS